MWKIQINSDARASSAVWAKRAKPVNGVNGTPTSFMPGYQDLERQFQELGFVDVRLHDAFGVGDIDAYFDAKRHTNTNQLLVAVPEGEKARARRFIADFSNTRVIFPNARAGMRDKNLSYARQDANFAPTDFAIRSTMQTIDAAARNPNGGEVMFRVGRTNDGGWDLPENFDVYASLVSDLVERYSNNYSAAGISRKVLYWEIWNEPDLPFFWNESDPTRFYEFYSTVARRIKLTNPSVKVGGAGAAFGLNLGGNFLDGLLQYCRDTGAPLDFLSWHFYPSETSDPQNILDAADSVSSALDAYGFHDAESLCTEWNFAPYATYNVYSKAQSAQNAAFVASTLIWMNACRVDKAYFLRGDSGAFGIFNDNPNPARPSERAACTYTAQAFYLYRQMLDMDHLLPTSDAGRTGVSILAGRSHREIRILVANYRLDKVFPRMDTPPKGNIFYKQNYVDSGRDLHQIADRWSRDHWFGGADPASLSNHNEAQQRPLERQLPSSSPYPKRTRDYAHSALGVSLAISNLSDRMSRVEAYRIVEGGDLSSLSPPRVDSELAMWSDGNDLRIDDPGAREYSVTLYKIFL